MDRMLVVLRHAKAEHSAATDHDRVLTGRGRKDALAAGRWLAEAGIRPDLTVCSTAARAKETWALASAEFGEGLATSYQRTVYTDDEDGVLEVLREIPDEVGTLLVVGHNPALRRLVLGLAGEGVEEDLRAVRDDFSTAAVAVLELDVPWAELDLGRAALRRFTVARG